jgi:hypothetical protein
MAAWRKHEKLCGVLGILCFLLWIYPLLHICNCSVFIAGMPLLFLYIFGVWVLAIIALYIMSNRLAPPGPSGRQEPGNHDQ